MATVSVNKIIKDGSMVNEYLDSLVISEIVMNKVGSEIRNRAIKLFIKILTNIINNPLETDKYGDLNYDKIAKKFQQCPVMIKLCILSGFEIINNENNQKRLRLQGNNDQCQFVLNKLRNRIKFEEEKLEKARKEVIQKNKQRLNTKENLKKKQMKDKILAQHDEQMKLAKLGIYNVGKTVADRKGTGNGVNSLRYN